MNRRLRWLVPFVFILTMLVPLVTLAADKPAVKAQIEVLSLEQCLDLAVKNSQQIQSAAKSVEIAQAAVKEAQAGLFPSLSYQYNDTYYTDNSLNGDADQTASAGLTLSQPLYTGGRLSNTLKLKKLSLESAREDERKAKENLTFGVKQAYYQYWSALQMRVVAQNSYDNLSRHVDQVNAFFKVGTVSRYDLLKAQVQRDSLKPQLVSAQNAVSLAKLGLATLIGKDKNQDFEVKIDLAQIKVPDQNAIDFNATLNTAYQNRSELRKIQQTAQITKLTTAITAAAYVPTINLSAAYSGTERGSNAFPNTDKLGLSFSLTVNGTLWNGGATQAKVAQSKGNEELTAIQESALRDQIRTEVEQSLQGITLGIETTKANQANIDLAKEGLRMAQARYDNGMGTTMDIMDAELALDTALNGYYSGVSNYLTAVAKLDMVVANDK